MRRMKFGFGAWVSFLLGLFLAAGCGATPIDVVDPALVGTWQGDCAVGLPVLFDPTQLPEDVVRTETTVAMTLTIHADTIVDGTVGEAVMQECVLKRNRGELGRQFNIATDYIVMDGYLAGPIVPGQDDDEAKAFTIPFNRMDGHLRGGLMWLEPLKYPYPLCDVDLARVP